jgi:hypothetical protein
MNPLLKILSDTVAHQLQCVEAHFAGDDTLVFHLVVVKFFSRKITILNHAFDLDLTSLLKLLNGRHPVCIVVTGKGLLRKQIRDGDMENAVRNIIQSGNVDHFVWNSFGDELWIARKELLDQLLLPFRESSHSVVWLMMGTGLLTNLKELLPLGSITSRRYTIINNHVIITVEQSNNPVSNEVLLSHFMLPADGLIAFAAGYCYFSALPAEQFTNLHNIVAVDRTNWNYRRRIRNTGITACVVLFALLVVNMFTFSFFNKRAVELERQNKGSLNVMEKYDSLNQQYKQRKDFLEKSGLNLDMDFAWMSDQIAMMVPVDIHLTSMVLFPISIDESIKSWTIRTGIITIEGSSRHPSWVNEYVQKLKTLEWIKDVEILYFMNEKPDELGVFKIQITIK